MQLERESAHSTVRTHRTSEVGFQRFMCYSQVHRNMKRNLFSNAVMTSDYFFDRVHSPSFCFATESVMNGRASTNIFVAVSNAAVLQVEMWSRWPHSLFPHSSHRVVIYWASRSCRKCCVKAPVGHLPSTARARACMWKTARSVMPLSISASQKYLAKLTLQCTWSECTRLDSATTSVGTRGMEILTVTSTCTPFPSSTSKLCKGRCSYVGAHWEIMRERINDDGLDPWREVTFRGKWSGRWMSGMRKCNWPG